MSEGESLPEFELEAFPGPGKVRLSDYRGKWLVLYFYPRDDTPGCTVEACNFRDSIGEIRKLGAEVLGVSTDDPGSHRKFSEKYGLNFKLASDATGSLSSALGVLKEGASRPTAGRSTFLVDPQGTVRRIYPKVSPDSHSGQILSDLRTLTR
ncbi:MAG: peroxiredoxin [Nitrososphaerota archaeon]|nr:peroxiredoxin [Nitrososphaerota archaeon]MDG6940246.1 peroxiredoxin [Nitrososphaerota archaeon]